MTVAEELVKKLDEQMIKMVCADCLYWDKTCTNPDHPPTGEKKCIDYRKVVDNPKKQH